VFLTIGSVVVLVSVFVGFMLGGGHILHKDISESQALRPFADQLLLDLTSEGLRAQIIDAQKRPLFDLGSARLKDYTVVILCEVARYVNSVPTRVSLSGHSDVKCYVSRSGYTNSEPCADRANAARRTLEGLAPEKIPRVVGLSSTLLYDKDHPESPVNRRISIVVLNRASAHTPSERPAAGESPRSAASK